MWIAWPRLFLDHEPLFKNTHVKIQRFMERQECISSFANKQLLVEIVVWSAGIAVWERVAGIPIVENRPAGE